MSDTIQGFSASKAVLVIFAIAMVAGLFFRVISEDTFKVAALMVFTYYFTSKGDPGVPYGGK
jgi:hypothetical protein